ncbi:hypothetical protein BCR33DRAFT_15032 [Rhizoclosmatium globosum]|uniref:RING-type domain-containing protein n=1 Tax=Rhizoclosmatium globosum TaxID=329046 RepID=A0A1Y2CPR8_9FUNG|nr:hypothetical protein BCR33DRAFT_15032 [Rhizoclosmatium globosum]|eukprot:ORY48957.1 hypothetical protein BCR33DRAFT_15032 [Rhizoclosmatium globosum]
MQPSATVPSNDPIADSSGDLSDEMPALLSDSDSDAPPSAVRPTQRANPPPIQHHHQRQQHQQPSDSDADSFPDLLSDSNSDQERTRPVQRPLLQQITRLAQAPQPNSALPSPTQRRHQPRLPPELVSRLSQLSQNRRIASIEMVNERLPVHQWSAADAPDGKSDCGICISEFEEQDSVRTLPCKHLFHSNCVDQWLTQGSVTCPSCRHPALDLPRIEPPSIGDIRLLLDILAPGKKEIPS